MGVKKSHSVLLSLNAVDNTGLSDTDLVFAVRNTLASVQNGDTDNYTQLVGSMYLKEYSDFDSVAQLETVLRVLSVSVTWLDAFHHRDLLSSIFQMSLWDHKTNVMDVRQSCMCYASV